VTVDGVSLFDETAAATRARKRLTVVLLSRGVAEDRALITALGAAIGDEPGDDEVLLAIKSGQSDERFTRQGIFCSDALVARVRSLISGYGECSVRELLEIQPVGSASEEAVA
jgi:hypothetical protein